MQWSRERQRRLLVGVQEETGKPLKPREGSLPLARLRS
jgi:hypothetical protein